MHAQLTGFGDPSRCLVQRRENLMLTFGSCVCGGGDMFIAECLGLGLGLLEKCYVGIAGKEAQGWLAIHVHVHVTNILYMRKLRGGGTKSAGTYVFVGSTYLFFFF